MQNSKVYPARKQLPHDIPAWVPDGSRYFITICCKERGPNTLARPGIADSLLHSIRIREDSKEWYVFCMVIMPDHLHLIAGFNKMPGIKHTIQTFKRYHARNEGVVWQSGFFEHRLRNDAEFTEKFHYVLFNPVRKQLVNDAREWPYKFCRGYF